MEKILEQTLLYDFYGELLTEHQRQVYEDVVLNDFSLSEVAAARGISRQGVHDLVRRCNKTLEEYEEKLHLVQRFVQIRENVNEIRKLTDPSGDTPKEDVMQRIAAIASDILEEFNRETPECFQKSQKQGPPDRGGCKDCAEGSKNGTSRGGCQLQSSKTVYQIRTGAGSRTGRHERTESGSDGH